MSNAEDVLQAKLQKLSPAQREALLKKLQQQKAAKAKHSLSLRDQPISSVARTQDNYPLSFAQQRLWFLQQLTQDQPGNNNAYNIAASFELSGDLNTTLLNQSLTLLVQRHESLRTVFISTAEGARQKVLERPSIRLHQHDLRDHSQNKHSALNELINQQSQQHFNLEQGPLLAANLFQLSDNRYVLNVVMHHIISDAWSANIIMAELSRSYNALLNNTAQVMPAPKLQYIDYSLWQRNYLNEINDKQLNFWQQELQGYENLNFVSDKPRSANQGNRGGFSRIQLSKAQAAQFSALCKLQGCSTFHGFLASYQMLLQRYTQQSDFCVGIPVAGRDHPDTESLIGFFVNSLAIRADVDHQLNFTQLIQKVKARCLNAQAHQELPFEKLVDHLKNEPAAQANSIDINPIFQTFFSYDQGNTDSSLQLENINSRYLPADVNSSKFDISLTLKDNTDGISCHFEFNRDLYQQQRIDQLAQHFKRLIQLICQQASTPISKLDLLSDAERFEQTVSFNQTQKSYSGLFVHQAIEQQAAKTPNAIAVKDSQQQLSYQQLNEQSNQLAQHLLAINIRLTQGIAIYLERSCNLSVALLAALKVGAPYIPLLPGLPLERAQYIIDDTQTEVLIGSAETLQDSQLQCNNTLNIESLLAELQAKNAANNTPGIPLTDSDLFNIIYTSGSTGQPKGVMVNHASISNRLEWMQDAYPINSSHKVLQKTPVNFDVSVWELFWPLMQGSTLVYCPKDAHKDPAALCDIIQQESITHCHFVPSMLGVFLEFNQSAECHSLERVFASGEALLHKHVKQFYQCFEACSLHNLYGPTEAAIDVSFYDCQADDKHSSIPIGKPIANSQLYILDANQQLLPKGAIGQLHIAGIPLANGYLNQTELSDKTFINNPFSNDSKLYKTGDLARFLDDGTIEYLGRIDHQVKIRGLRIELGEIEHRLNQIEGIAQSVVKTQLINQQTQLIAHLVYEDNAEPLETHTINKQLAKFLPDYMQPMTYLCIDEVPLSANGKINRKALPDADISTLSQREFIAARNPTEQSLVDIWQDLLGHDNIGVFDNFFELGGHSLLATQLLIRIREQFTIDLPLRTLFEVSNIAGIAEMISVLQTNALDDIDDDEGFEEGIL